MDCPAVGTSLGVILNELVTNALKHSFGADDTGTISLVGTRTDNLYRIVCSDNGTANAQASSGGGLGVHIMAAAIQKISGTLTSGPTATGYQSMLEFPVGNVAI